MSWYFFRKGDVHMVSVIITALLLIIVAVILIRWIGATIPTSFKEAADLGKDVGNQLGTLLGNKASKQKTQEDAQFLSFSKQVISAFQTCAQSPLSNCWCKFQVASFPDRYSLRFFEKPSIGYFSLAQYTESKKTYLLSQNTPFAPYVKVPKSLERDGLFCFLGSGNGQDITDNHATQWEKNILIYSDGEMITIRPDFGSQSLTRDRYFSYPLKQDIYLFKTSQQEVCFAPIHFKPVQKNAKYESCLVSS